MQNHTKNDDLGGFIQQLETMYQRLGRLYSHVGTSDQPTKLFADALKELGCAAEELQVASEELQQQNEQIYLNLADAELQTQHYQSLFEHAPQAQLVTTIAGKILTANQAATQLLRLPISSFIDRLLIRFVPLSQRTLFRSHLTRLQQFQQPQTWAGNIQLQTGELLEVVFTVAADKTDEAATLRWTLQEAAVLRAAMIQAELGNETDAQPPLPSTDTRLDRYPKYRFSRGDTIPLQPQTLYCVAQGLVKLTTLTANNEEILLGLVGRSTPFLPGSTRLLTYQATALSDVQIVRISIEEAQTNLAPLLLHKFLQRLQQAEAMLHVAGQRRTKDRLYHLLKLLADETGEAIVDGVRIGVRLTHEDLANACCTTRVTITRLLGDLQRQQKIRFDRKFHIILQASF